MKETDILRVIDKQIRGVVNVVFYVQHVEKKSKEHGWQDAGWFVNVKHYNREAPFHFDHCPSQDELKKLWRWH